MSLNEEWASLINEDDADKSGRVFKDQELIKYLDKRLYTKYEPTKSPGLDFNSRMDRWINNVNDMDEKVQLHGLIPKIFFVGEEEFNSLYRVAMHEVVIPWIVDECDLSFTGDKFEETLEEEVLSTWFCPISDSLRINAFYHVNHIVGREFRPDWRSLAAFSDVKKVKDFVGKNKIKRIVLLEDFVGSGGQASGILNFIEKNNFDVNVIIVPLVICPKGNQKIISSIDKIKRIEYKPVLLVPNSEIFTPIKADGEKQLIEVVRSINQKYHNSMGVDFSVDEKERTKIGSYGYRNTGSLIVMYSNCPNNSLALIHAENELDWTPLFPRSERV